MTVHVIGSINVDIIASVERLPGPGETVLALSCTRLPGGKGANQAVAAARMGVDCRMTGAVGDDEPGEWMRGRIGGYGVEIAAVATVAGPATGTAYIAVDNAGENQIIVAPGANHAVITPPPVTSGVLLAQLEVPVATIAPLFAASAGALRILNAAPPDPAVRAMLDDIDILIVNEHELAVLAPAAPRDDMPAAARSLMRGGGPLVIVTLGARGLLAVWPDRQRRFPAFAVEAVDTIGAGDCFCGSLAALLDDGEELEDALIRASAAAALCTLHPGAAPAMPTRDAVAAFIRTHATESAQRIKNEN